MRLRPPEPLAARDITGANHCAQLVAPTIDSAPPGLKVSALVVRPLPTGRNMVASLHQARAIDHRRLSTKLGQLDDSDFDRVREEFWKLYK